MDATTTVDAPPKQDLVRLSAFPVSLGRLNWGAFLLAPLWALWYSVWPWVLVFVGLRVGSVFVGGVVRSIWPVSLPPHVVSTVVLEAAYWGIAVASV